MKEALQTMSDHWAMTICCMAFVILLVSCILESIGNTILYCVRAVSKNRKINKEQITNQQANKQ